MVVAADGAGPGLGHLEAPRNLDAGHPAGGRGEAGRQAVDPLRGLALLQPSPGLQYPPEDPCRRAAEAGCLGYGHWHAPAALEWHEVVGRREGRHWLLLRRRNPWRVPRLRPGA